LSMSRNPHVSPRLQAQLGIREGMSGMLSQKSLEHEWEELKKSRAAVLKLQADLEAEAVTMRSMNVLTKSGVMKFDLASGVTGMTRSPHGRCEHAHKSARMTPQQAIRPPASAAQTARE